MLITKWVNPWIIKANNLFTCCYHDGRIYGFNLGKNLKDKMEFTRLFSVSGMKYPREIEVVPELNLLFVGYVGGYIYIFRLDDPRFPICKHFGFKKQIFILVKMNHVQPTNNL